MQKLVFSLLIVTTLYARADLANPAAAVITGDNAKSLQATIIQITRAKPTEGMFGRKIVNAPADVSCSQYTDGKITCTVSIKQ